jgi:uncharacterized repeat protein (TIGR01451 family)
VVLVAFANIEGLTTTDHAAVTKAIDENGDYAPDKTDQATVDVTRPEVSVRKILHANQDHEVQVGSDVTYDIGVTNSGDTSLTTVPLSDTWDGSVFSFVSASPDASATTGSSATWNQLGTLERGQTTTVTVTLHAEATSRGAASVDTATVSRALDVNEDAAPDASATADERVTNPKIAIVKSLHAGQDHEIQPGQDATFDLAITNVGDTALSAVPLSDTWDGSVFEYSSAIPSAVATTGSSATWTNVGPIAVGQTTTVTVTLHALAPSPVLSTTDTATVSARDEYGDTAKPDTSTASLLVTRPDASIVKRKTAAQDHVVQVGQSVTYEFIVTNTGDTTLATVPLSDTFDAGALAFATATVAPDTSSTVGSVGHLGWNNLGQLAPGDSAEVTATFTAIAVPAGQISTDTALISGVTDEYHDVVADKTDPSVIRITRPGVTITKTLHAGQDPAVQASQTVTFDLVVANTGDTTLTTVPVRDVYDATWLAATGATPSLTTSSPGELDWDNVGPLDVGVSTTLTVTFSARHNPPGQTTIDTATALPATDIYNDHTPSSTSTAGVKITAPSLTLTKSLDASQDPFVQAGQLVTFDLTVKNTGDTTLTTVPLSDTWDAAHFTFSTASLPASIQVGNNAAWTLGPIAPGASQTVKTTLLAVGSFTSHSLVDTATVMGALDENADHPNDALATATVDLTRGAVDVTKSLAPGQDSVVQVGQSVTFDITVQNTGDVDLAKVPLTDVFDPAVFQFTSASPSASSTAAGSATWANLGPLAVGETKTVTLTLTAIGTSALASSIDSATVSGATDIHGDPAAGDSASGGATVTHPAVSVAKNLAAGQSASVPVGTDVTYDLIVTNTGDTTLSSAALADTFDPAQLSFVSASVTPDASSAGSVSFNNVIGPLGLAPGASTRVSITLHTLVDGAGITDTALVSAATDTFGDSAGTAQADNALLGVYAPGAFSGIKTAEPPAGTIVKPGETITYTLAWNNTSAVTVPGVIASDPLPNSVRYVPGTLELGSAPQTDADDSDAGTYDSASRTVRFNVGDVAGHSGGAATFQVTVAPDNLSAAGVLNTASFSNSQGPLGSTDPVYQPVDPFKIIKTGKDLNGGKLRGGDIIEWTITVTNNGLMPTTHVHVSDNVPSTTTYVSGSISGKGADDSTAPLLKWDIGTMQVGEVQVLKLRSRVKKGLPTGTQIRNQASVVSDQSHTKKSDNPQTATAGDPTVMVAQTSGSEDWRLPLSAGLLLLAGAAVVEARRRRRTAARAAAHRAYRQSSAE